MLYSSLVVWQVGCRAVLSDGAAIYHDGHGSIASDGIEALKGQPLQTPTLDCKLDYPANQIMHLDMILYFEPPGERCTW